MVIASIAIFTFLVIFLFNLIFRFIDYIFSTDDYIFTLGLSIIFTLGLLQSSTLWYLLITSKPIDALNSIVLVALLVFIFFAFNFNIRKTKVLFKIESFHLFLIFVATLIVTIALVSTIILGDTGWDSNAYHIPLIGMLTEWGSNSWPDSLSEGAYTIYTPYGVHSIQALFVSIFSDFRVASIPTGMLFIGGTLLSTTLVSKKTSKIVIMAAISVTPSVFGQLSRNYVDIWAGIYLFSALIVFAKMFTLNRSKESDIKFYVTASFILGLSASSKTQALISSILILLVISIMRIHRDKSLSVKFFATLATTFTFSSAVPYLRNLIFEQNPIYPIINPFFSNGTISTSDLSTAVSIFRPQFWPHDSIIDPLLSIVTPLWVLIVMMLNKLGIYLDATRIDISAFTYDTTTGGPGILSSILILSATLVALFQSRKFRVPRILSIEIVLSIFAIIIFLFTPGSWYPRYGMALYFILLILAVRYLEKFSTSFFSVLLLIGGGIPSVFGLTVFQNYDFYSNHRDIHFNPKYGLDTPPKEFSVKCKNVAILEPRPTFTSFIWESNCDRVISLGSETKLLPNDFFIVANHRLDPQFIANRKSCNLGTWFDPTLTYGTFLYSPINFEGSLCNSPVKKTE